VVIDGGVQDHGWRPQEGVARIRMKMQDVIFRAIAKKLNWWQAAEILGVSDATMTRWLRSYQKNGYDPVYWIRPKGHARWRSVPLAVAEKALFLYQRKYSHLSVAQFRAALSKEHDIRLPSEWNKVALEGAGLMDGGSRDVRAESGRVKKPRKRATNRLPARSEHFHTVTLERFSARGDS